MQNAFSAVLGLIAPILVAATISNAVAAPPAQTAEGRYIVARDAACIAIRASYDKAEQAKDDLRFEKIDRKAYDKLANLRQKGEDECKRCFTQNVPKQPSFAEATRQAERLLSAALNTR